MFTHSRMAKLGVFALFATVSFVWGQDFSVTGRSSANGTFLLRLDETLVITLSATGPNGTAVVPELVPRNAAQANSLSATWIGTSATTNLSALAFKIHLYDNEALCGENFPFDLYFTPVGSNTRIKANDPLNLLNLGTSADGLIALEQSIVHLIEPPPYPLSAGIATEPLRLEPHTASDFDGKRIYWLIDWNLQGRSSPEDFADAFGFFNMPLDANKCFLQAKTDIVPNALDHMVTGQVLDITGNSTVEVPLAPYGGGGIGPSPGTGINIFDVTDVVLANTNCNGGTVAQRIDYLSESTVWRFDYWYKIGGIINITIRESALYLGQQGGCTALSDNFGTPPGSSTRIEDFTLTSDGDVSATLTVPASWRTGSSLASAYRVQYYLRTGSTYRSLGAPTQSLSVNAATDLNIEDPRDYFLEAQVYRIDNGATIHVSNRDYNHSVGYRLLENDISFQGQEQTPLGIDDQVLDPGEVIQIPYLIEAASGTLPPITWKAGAIFDSNDNDNIDISDYEVVDNNQQQIGGFNIRIGTIATTGSAGQTNYEVTTSFELLTAPVPNKVWFYLEGTFTDPETNTPTTFRRYTSISDTLDNLRDINAQDTILRSDFDFSTSNYGWTAETGAGRGVSTGWSWSAGGPWVGQGSTDTANATTTYALTSPPFVLGSLTNLTFNHLTQFTFNQSAGVLEYCASASDDVNDCDDWNNLILDYGSASILNRYPFPTNPPSYLSGERVWMTHETQTQNVGVNIPQSLTNLYDGDGWIFFRYLFQDPSLEFTGSRSDGPTRWELNSFNYETRKVLLDNLFRVDLASLNLILCENTLLFYSDAPLHYSALEFYWYPSLQDLKNNTNVQLVIGDPEIPLNTSVQGNYDYYVRIAYGNTERIYNVKISRNSAGCGPGPCIDVADVLGELRQESGGWPVRNLIDILQIFDQVCDNTN